MKSRGDKMAGSRLLKGIHVIGYVTTVIVLVEMAGLGYLSWFWWSKSEPIRARFRESTRTHDRALGGPGNLDSDAAKSYQPVRPPTDKSDDALGFVFMPSFSPWYATSLRLPHGAEIAQGELVHVQHSNETGQITFSQVQTFTVPRAAYLAAAQRIDSLTHGWPGNGDGSCFDGVEVAFERFSAGRVTSGEGNASCDTHYAAVANVMKPLLLRYSPKPGKDAPPPGADRGPAATGPGPTHLEIPASSGVE